MRKVQIKLIFLCLILVGWDNPFSRTLSKKTREGNQYYDQNQLDKALKAYTEAQLVKPDSPELHFNIGDVLYRQRRYLEALAEYQRVLVDERDDLKAKAYYNIGNSFYRLNMLQQAVGAYKKALEHNPDDKDTKANLEFVQAKLQQQQKEEKPQQEDSSSPSDQDRSDKSRDKEKEEQELAEEERDEEQREKEKKPQPEEGMSKEDAERLLDALEDDEKEVQRALRKPIGEIQIEKDW